VTAAKAGVLLPLLLAPFGFSQSRPQLAVPDWLAPFPGAATHTQDLPLGGVEISYRTGAAVKDVLAHYQGLFAGAGEPFRPQMYGPAAVVSATPTGSNLTIQIRPRGANTFVTITCTERPVFHTLQPGDVESAMQKYDQPVYPGPATPMPALAWPAWLPQCDGAPATIHKGVDQFKVPYLQAVFRSTWDRKAIQEFYKDLLNANGYQVYLESSRLTPPDRPAIVAGAYYFGRPGPRWVIRAELTTVEDGVQVELRVEAHR